MLIYIQILATPTSASATSSEFPEALVDSNNAVIGMGDNKNDHGNQEENDPVFIQIRESIESAKKYCTQELKKPTLDSDVRSLLQSLQKYVFLLDTTCREYSNFVIIAEKIMLDEGEWAGDVDCNEPVSLQVLETMVSTKKGEFIFV